MHTWNVCTHILTHLASANEIMKTIDFMDNDQVTMNKILIDLDRIVVLNAYFKVVIRKFKDAKKNWRRKTAPLPNFEFNILR